MWWGDRDPAFLYADDGTLFVQNAEQLPGIIAHIKWVGKFTGLSLNLNKTIAYNHKHGSRIISGIKISNDPVKYLGALIGDGDLSSANFEHLLKKA